MLTVYDEGGVTINYTDKQGTSRVIEDSPQVIKDATIAILTYIESQKTPEELTAEKLLTYVSLKATDEEKLTMVDVFPCMGSWYSCERW